ncbi:MAG: hypothetical protein ACTSWQ_06645 [Candidatus Thorarchaeota archaeon]
MDMYVAKHHATGMPRNYEFYEIIQDNFEQEWRSEYYLSADSWAVFLEKHPDVAKKFPDEVDVMTQLIDESEFQAITVVFY